MTWIKNASPEVNSKSNYPMLITASSIVTLLMVIVVAGRLWMRTRRRWLGKDDYCIIVSAVFAVIYWIQLLLQTQYGLGLPPKLRPHQDLDTYFKLNYSCRSVYNVAIGGFKVALCLAYLSYINNTNKRAYRLTIWGVLVFCVATRIVIICGLIFNCQPIKKGWNPTISGKCLSVNGFYYSDAAFTMLGDLAVFFLPIPMVMGLKIGRREKFWLTFAFLLGLITTICSIMRILQIPKVAKLADSSMLILWGLMEANAGIITTSLPAFRPLIRRLKEQTRIGASYGRSTGGSNAKPFSHTGSRGTVGLQYLSSKKEVGSSTAGSQSKWTTRTESQENILMSEGVGIATSGSPKEVGSIVRTTDIDVTSETRHDGEDGHRW